MFTLYKLDDEFNHRMYDELCGVDYEKYKGNIGDDYTWRIEMVVSFGIGEFEQANIKPKASTVDLFFNFLRCVHSVQVVQVLNRINTGVWKNGAY